MTLNVKRVLSETQSTFGTFQQAVNSGIKSYVHAGHVELTAPTTVPATCDIVDFHNGAGFGGSEALTIGRMSADPKHRIFLDTVEPTFLQGACDCIRPEWFGAVADHSTDCTFALNAAIQCAKRSGVKKVKLSAGTYRTGPVVMRSGVTLEGAGPQVTTLFLRNAANQSIIRNEDYSPDYSVVGLTLDGNASANSSGHGISFYMGNGAPEYDPDNYQGNSLTLHNITVRNCAEHGIKLDGLGLDAGSFWSWRNANIETVDAQECGNTGVALQMVRSSSIRNLLVKNNGHKGLHLSLCQDLCVQDLRTHNNGLDSESEGATGLCCEFGERIALQGAFASFEYGIGLGFKGSQHIQVSGAVVSSNGRTGQERPGMAVVDSEYFTVAVAGDDDGETETQLTALFIKDSSKGSAVITSEGHTVSSYVLDGATSQLLIKVNGEQELPTFERTANRGVANGYAPLDAEGKVPSAFLSVSGVSYKGNWDASTNTPTLSTPDVARAGEMYRVNVAGTQFSIDWGVGDWAIYKDDGVLERSPNASDVTSVNGETGDVVLTTTDITEGSNLYFTNARARSALSGSSPILYNSGTGVISHSTAAGNRHLPSGGVGPNWLLFGHPSDSGRGQWIENEFAQNHYVFWSGSKFDYESSGLRNLSGGSVACDGFFTAGKLTSSSDVVATEKLIATNTEIYKSGTHETIFKNSVSAFGQHNFIFEGDINALSLTIDSITDTSASITADPDRRLVYYNPATGKFGASSGQSSLTLELGQLRTPDIRTATNTDLTMRRNNIERLRLTSAGVEASGAVSGLSSLRIGDLALQDGRTVQTQVTSLNNVLDVVTHTDGNHFSSIRVRAAQGSGSLTGSTHSFADCQAYGHNATGTTLGISSEKSVFFSAHPATGGVLGVGTSSAADVIFARNNAERLRLTSGGVNVAGALTTDSLSSGLGTFRLDESGNITKPLIIRNTVSGVAGTGCEIEMGPIATRCSLIRSRNVSGGSNRHRLSFLVSDASANPTEQMYLDGNGNHVINGNLSGLSSLRIGELALQTARTIQTQTNGITNIVDCRMHSDGQHSTGFYTLATSADGSASENDANIVSMLAYAPNATGNIFGVNRGKSSFLSARPATGGVLGVGTSSAADVIFARNNAERLRLKDKEVTIAGVGVGVRMPYRVITDPNSPPVSYSYSGASATDAQIFIGGSQITVVEITETPQELGSILTVINGRNVNIELNAYGNFGSPWYTIQPNCCMSFRRVPGGWSKVI